jgi:outer membrane protein OmpA-like peptidoglycan-associated protein/tetratricopeptide (TPR) repeat protein
MKRHIAIFSSLVLFLFISSSVKAQDGILYKANKLYNLMAYSEAIPKYEEVLKKDSSKSEALIKLADCYRLTNNVEKAVVAYSKVVKLKEALPIHKLYYAQLLMQVGKYTEAKKWMEEYKADERGETFVKSINKIQKFYKDSASYKIKKAQFNSDYNDFGPLLYGNNKVIFTSSRPRTALVSYIHSWTLRNYCSVYITEKDGSGKYSKPHRFAKKLQNKLNDGPACFTPDEKTIYLTRNNVKERKALRAADGNVKLLIYIATFGNKDNTYENIHPFKWDTIEFNTAHPSISADGNKIYFSSDRPGTNGGMDIWMCRKVGDNWGAPINLGNMVNSKGNELFPFALNNEKLYFTSNGLEGLGGLDLYEVQLDSSGMPKGKVFNMGYPLNTTYDDFSLCLDKAGKTGFFSSNRSNLKINDDIYELEILKQAKREIIIKGTAIDKSTGDSIPGARIAFVCGKDTLAKVFSDNLGQYQFSADYDKEYVLSGQKKDYYDVSNDISTMNSDTVEVIISNLLMEKDPGISLYILITDAKTNLPLKDVKIELLDKISGKSEILMTPETGDHRRMLTDKKTGDSLSYGIKLSKDGYLNKTVSFFHSITKHGEIKILESLDKLEIGVDLGKLVHINPIYFDLNKSNIRPDAAVELDKIVKVMKEYPSMVIELGAHTDCRGSYNSNTSLSDRRAKASAAYIVSQGVGKDRIYGKGYGETKLINKCECEGKKVVPCTEVEHQQNRRTEFVIVRFK